MGSATRSTGTAIGRLSAPLRRAGRQAGTATRPVMVVSPHLDDAVLSAWGLMARSPGALVLNVFCAAPQPAQRTDWDRRCGFDDSDQAVRTRLAEDRRALSGLPVEREQLGLIEGQYLIGDRSPDDARMLVDRIAIWVEEAGRDGLIALPAGAGWTPRSLWARLSRTRWLLPAIPPNPDHLFVRDAVLGALPRLGQVEIWLYEELPYRWGARGEHAVRTLAAERGLGVQRRELSVTPGAKAAMAGAYASQIPHLRGRRWQPLLNEPTGVPRRERYWRLAPVTRASVRS